MKKSATKSVLAIQNEIKGIISTIISMTMRSSTLVLGCNENKEKSLKQ